MSKWLREILSAKMLSIIAFSLLTCLLYIIWINPLANGYELSIYDGLPSYFWFLLIIIILLGIAIIIHPLLTGKKSREWLFGFGIVLFCLTILILVHSFRGYPLSDPSDLNFHHRLTLQLG